MTMSGKGTEWYCSLILSSEKFDLASFMKHPAIAAEVKEKVVSQCTELVETAATLLSEYGTKLSEAIQSKISLSLTALQEAISKEEVTAEALEVLEKQLEESMKELIKIAEVRVSLFRKLIS